MNDLDAPKDEVEYRYSRHVLEIGVAGALCFGSMGIVSVLAALLNVDGSFRFPIGAAIIFGLWWSFMTLLSGWLVLAYVRHRLFVSRNSVCRQGAFRKRELQIASVQRAVWKSRSSGGKLILHEIGGNKVAVEFGSYTFRERLALIRFFREALANDLQEGWDCFASRCLPQIVDYQTLNLQMRGYLRFAALGFGIALPVMWALLILVKLLDGAPDRSWFSVVFLPLGIIGAFLGLMWFASRVDLAKAK